MLVRAAAAVLCSSLVLSAMRAQPPPSIAEADAKVAAGEFEHALDLLLPLVSTPLAAELAGAVGDRLADIGEQLREAAKADAALRAAEAALTLRQQLHGKDDHADVAASLNYVSACLYGLGRLQDALAKAEAGLAMRERLFAERDHADVATSHNNVAAAALSLGRFDDARAHLEAALAIEVRLHGEDGADAAIYLNNIAYCLRSLGRPAEALPRLERVLAIYRRIHGEIDHADVATALGSLGSCLQWLGRAEEALSRQLEALAMRQRLFGDRDHPDVAQSLNDLGVCLGKLQRHAESLQRLQQALDILERLYGERDHPSLARVHNDIAVCLHDRARPADAARHFSIAFEMRKRLFGGRDHPELANILGNWAPSVSAMGQAAEALRLQESALDMLRRIWGGRDHPSVAGRMNDVAAALSDADRLDEALAIRQEAMAMAQRLCGDRDDPLIARMLAGMGSTLRLLGRSADALPHFEAALAMNSRLLHGRDADDAARVRNGLGMCLQSLGRSAEANDWFESALAMQLRLHGDEDHPAVVLAQSTVAFGLQALGRFEEAEAHQQAALAMSRRMHPDGDDQDVAMCSNNLAAAMQCRGRPEEALAMGDEAIAMWQRLFAGQDHHFIATAIGNRAACLGAMGRWTDALAADDAALAMWLRLHGDRDHPSVMRIPGHRAQCLRQLGRTDEAITALQQAATMVERLMAASRNLSGELRLSLFDELKKGAVFEQLQQLQVEKGLVAEALLTAERSRGRELLDLLEQQRADPLEVAERRARASADRTGVERIAALRRQLADVEREDQQSLRQLLQFDPAHTDSRESSDVARAELMKQAEAVHLRRRRLLDERARIVAEVAPMARLRSLSDIQSSIAPDELLVEFTVLPTETMVWLVPPAGGAVQVRHVAGSDVLAAPLESWLGLLARGQIVEQRGRDPERGKAPRAAATTAGRALFAALFPPELWREVKDTRRLIVVAHRLLHRLPFETLVVGEQDGSPVHWLDVGPQIAYVPSACALHWLRSQVNRRAGTGLDLLAVGDPRPEAEESARPAQGALIVGVVDGSQAAAAGLERDDVLLAYDGVNLQDERDLSAARARADASVAAGGNRAVELRVWHLGATRTVVLRTGPLGVQLGRGPAAEAWLASRPAAEQVAIATRRGDATRVDALPPLLGARKEVLAIAGAFGESAKVRTLIGTEAREETVFENAVGATFLHFACHGLAEELAGQSLSMLVLSRPVDVRAEADGMLGLDDLVQRWRGRLEHTRLVVLSACRTHVGPQYRDEAPQALPVGFLFAGARAVVGSLWSVDDASTASLMTDLYRQMLQVEADPLTALVAAKRRLRDTFPDPFHWGGFLFLGLPQ